MRTPLILLFGLISLQAFNQTISHDSVVTIRSQGIWTKPQFKTYVSKDGYEYNVGDKIKIGKPSAIKEFAFIMAGDGVIMAPEQLKANAAGEEIEIKKIYLIGTKKTGAKIYFWTKAAGVVGYNYTIDVENAIESGELKSFGMSSDEALAELKKLKDKLDLGLITQEEYDKRKTELAKIIK